MKIIVVIITCLGANVLMAQNKTSSSMEYKTAVGLRFWKGAGLNLKTFVQDKKAVDVGAFFWSEGSLLVANYEFHGDLSTEGNFKWYLGAGPNVSFIKSTKETVVGVQGVIGLDYKFKSLPLNIALDWQPTFRFKKSYGYIGELFALSVRYTL